MVINGTVIDIKFNLSLKNRNGKNYNGYRLAYRNENQEIKEITKTMQSLDYIQDVKGVLETLQGGDDFSLVVEKNEAGFYDLVSLAKGHSETVNPEKTPAAVIKGSQGATVARSYPAKGVEGKTWETAEERKLKQRLIVRQSSINAAIDMYKLAGGAVSQAGVLNYAAEFEAWVYRELT